MSFSPSSQVGSKMPIGKAFKSNAPTLTYLDLCYGEGSAITWLVAWISDVYGVCGFVNNEVTDNIKIMTANAIKDEYYFLNLNELITFFKMFIAGKFEKFYKKPNPQVITKSLNTFCSHRIDAIKAVEANIKKEKEAKEDEAIKQNAITYEEWAARKKAKGEEVNRLLNPKRGGQRKGILVFTKFVKEAQMLTYSIPNCEMVCGETPPKEREAIIERFRNGQTKVLVNSQILVVGFDYPELDTVEYAKPTRSLAQYYQVVGRLLRLSKGKQPWFVDLCGTYDRFGKVEDLKLLDQNGRGKWVIMSGNKQLTNAFF